MSMTVGQWGISRIYGYPGDGINGLTASLRKAENHPRFIQVRHEEMAAFMACAHAKFTGQVGVCLAARGPGAIHLLNGLYDARMDHQPVVAIVGPAWDAALRADRPVVLEAVTAPNVPMLPPHITLEQARKLTAALLKGDSDAPGIIRQTVKTMIDAVTR